ncbi:MAG: hypothetical protein MZU95_15120 [Desulfomicrobium escambiense]|nr:hypothetical protein [Desulfomicrobium escambiense]
MPSRARLDRRLAPARRGCSRASGMAGPHGRRHGSRSRTSKVVDSRRRAEPARWSRAPCRAAGGNRPDRRIIATCDAKRVKPWRVVDVVNIEGEKVAQVELPDARVRRAGQAAPAARGR